MPAQPTADQQAVLHHVSYEWQMFCFTYDLLRQLPDDTKPVRYAILESLVIHGRALIEFFDKGGSKPTDFKLSQLDQSYVPLGLVDGTPIHTWHVDANKRVAHLTEQRRTELYEWQADEVRRELQGQIDIIEARFGKFLDLWPASADQIALVSKCFAPPKFGRYEIHLDKELFVHNGTCFGGTVLNATCSRPTSGNLSHRHDQF